MSVGVCVGSFVSIWYAGDIQQWFGLNEGNVKDVQVPKAGENADEKLIDGIKDIVNYVLWLLALVTLILLIYGWVLMLLSATDDGWYKKWFTILKNASIGLAFIAFSWLMVSFIYFILSEATK